MSRAALLRELVQDIAADAHDYVRLHELLEAQFAAAIAHRSAEIAEIGARILALAETLEARRVRRVALVGDLATADRNAASVEHAFSLLPPPTQPQVRTLWAALEARVRECKALNVRNSQLMTSQHEIMQRVLDMEPDTYVPA